MTPRTDIGTVRVVIIDAYPQNGTRAERETNTSALEALARIERVVTAARTYAAETQGPDVEKSYVAWAVFIEALGVLRA